MHPAGLLLQTSITSGRVLGFYDTINPIVHPDDPLDISLNYPLGRTAWLVV